MIVLLTRAPARFKQPFMPIDPRYLEFGEAVSFRRRKLKLKQSDLAARVGMSRASIANIERGRQNVLLHHAYDITQALGLTNIADLLPLDSKPSLEDQSLALAMPEQVTSKAKAQISELIATAMAKAKS